MARGAAQLQGKVVVISGASGGIGRAAALEFASARCRLVLAARRLDALEANAGVAPEAPFVLVAQQSHIDDTRAPLGRHTGWAYCHVPHDSDVDMTQRIERQIERFAPGFRDVILARHVMNPRALQRHNPNMIGRTSVVGPTRCGLVGVLMWPAVALHAVLAVWCIACLRSGSANASGR
jgi:NAD(P)-dependent dehydrogenase (short-subunit alcohol dehydrogenase family)